MRLLHAVTLVSPDGAFGGPVRVAENQAAALRGRGHDVQVAAGERGYARPPTELGGTPARLFRVRRALPGGGFSGLVSPPMLRWLRQELRQTDVLHLHLGRDLVTLPVALLAQRLDVPYVLQPHGMVQPSGHPLAAPLDAALTRRVLRGASAVLYLTDLEAAGLDEVARGALPLVPLGNGVPVPDRPTPLPARAEVLFCARLHERKRPVLFAQAAQRLLAEGVDASFVLVGPDEGQGAAVAALVAQTGDPSRLRWEGPLAPDATLDRMRRCSLFVLPSVDEPNGMAVLEALSVGRPVVVTDTCGLARAVRDLQVGLVVDASLQGLVDGVRRALGEPGLLTRLAERAAPAVRDHFGMGAVVDVLEELYGRAVRRETV